MRMSLRTLSVSFDMHVHGSLYVALRCRYMSLSGLMCVPHAASSAVHPVHLQISCDDDDACGRLPCITPGQTCQPRCKSWRRKSTRSRIESDHATRIMEKQGIWLHIAVPCCRHQPDPITCGICSGVPRKTAVDSDGCVTLYTCADMEGHVGRDGKVYVVDCARLFPPTMITGEWSVASHDTSERVS